MLRVFRIPVLVLGGTAHLVPLGKQVVIVILIVISVCGSVNKSSSLDANPLTSAPVLEKFNFSIGFYPQGVRIIKV